MLVKLTMYILTSSPEMPYILTYRFALITYVNCSHSFVHLHILFPLQEMWFSFLSSL